MNVSRTCAHCGATYDTRQLVNLCRACGGRICDQYDLAPDPALRDAIRGRPATMWRYAEVLPARETDPIVSLGEGITPLLPSRTLPNLWIKDESKNPTRSFKSRGMAAAVTMARALGATSLAAPTAGNAGAALSAYGARAGLPVFVAMPGDTPSSIVRECRDYGAQVELVAGGVTDPRRRGGGDLRRNGGVVLLTPQEAYPVLGKE